jgi:response regulator of citrate/malate metabolism
VEFVRGRQCDLVLLDLMMPSPNGVETLGHFREVRPGLEVVIITAFFDTKLMDEALQFGPLTILKKPIERDVLETLLSGQTAKAKLSA